MRPAESKNPNATRSPTIGEIGLHYLAIRYIAVHCTLRTFSSNQHQDHQTLHTSPMSCPHLPTVLNHSQSQSAKYQITSPIHPQSLTPVDQITPNPLRPSVTQVTIIHQCPQPSVHQDAPAVRATSPNTSRIVLDAWDHIAVTILA